MTQPHFATVRLGLCAHFLKVRATAARNTGRSARNPRATRRKCAQLGASARNCAQPPATARNSRFFNFFWVPPCLGSGCAQLRAVARNSAQPRATERNMSRNKAQASRHPKKESCAHRVARTMRATPVVARTKICAQHPKVRATARIVPA